MELGFVALLLVLCLLLGAEFLFVSAFVLAPFIVLGALVGTAYALSALGSILALCL